MHLRESEWLMAIKQRAAIPGGVCEFDLPAYHYWLNKEPAARQRDLAAWIEPFDADPRRLGDRAAPAARERPHQPAHRVPRRVPADADDDQGRAAAAPDAAARPALRAGDQRQQIRAQHPLHRRFGMDRGNVVDQDIEFELMFCNL